MIKTIRTGLAVICVLVIAMCAFLILQKMIRRARLDLTQQKIYTLSPGTRNILGQLNQPVKLTLYYSRTAAMKGPDEVRFFNSYYVYVRDLLDEYVRLANGRLKLEVVDPRRYSDEEDKANEQGLKGLPITEEDNFYFGLVAETELGKVKAIPIFKPDRQEFVEYDISSLVSSVVLRDKKKVGVLSSLDVAGPEMSPYMVQMMRMQGRDVPAPWSLITKLRGTYDVESVAKDADSIPGDVDFLLVIHPKELPKKTLFAIDQFVMKKSGRLIVFEDPYCLMDQDRTQNPYMQAEKSKSSDLNALLRGWGVEMDPDEVVVDRTLAIKASLMQGQRPQTWLPFMQIKDETISRQDIVTAPLHDIRVIFAGALKEVEGKGVRVTPLLTTTATGNIWKPANPFELQMPDAEGIRRAVTDGAKPVMIACRITGKFRTNFPDGLDVEEKKDSPPAEGADKDKPKEEAKPKKIEGIKEASSEGAILVFADVDMIADILAYRNVFFDVEQAGDNASLVFNSLDFLSGSSDLVAIRSRGGFNRPFDVVDNIERDAEARTSDQVNAAKDRIKEYQDKLSKLRTSLTEGNEKLVASQAVAERTKLEEDVRKANKELRNLNAKKRVQIEALGSRLWLHNMLWAPACVLLIAIALGIVRSIRARYYARRASS